MKQPKFTTEVELAQAVANWAETQGWEVFKEVFTNDGDIDLVLVQGRAIWAIECKLRLGADVLEQATTRRKYAHYVSVATPKVKEVSDVLRFYAESSGIGMLQVAHPETKRIKATAVKSWEGRPATRFEGGPDFPVRWDWCVDEELRAKVVRPNDLTPRRRRWRDETPGEARQAQAKRIAVLRASLRPEHKLLVAGAPCGSQLTPWRCTMIDVQRFLKLKGPSTVKEIVAGVKHHYRNDSSARAGIFRMVSEIKVKEFVSTVVDGETKWANRPS